MAQFFQIRQGIDNNPRSRKMSSHSKYNLAFSIENHGYGDHHYCREITGYSSRLSVFISRLNDYSVCHLIRDINEHLDSGYGEEELFSDPWEDMDVGIRYPDFYIDELTLPLTDMKSIFYEWLSFTRPGAEEYFNTIENRRSLTVREGQLLQFKKTFKNWRGRQQYKCESLIKSHAPLCFVQYCRKKDCAYILQQIDNILNDKAYDKEPFSKRRKKIVTKLDRLHFTITNTTDNSGISMSPSVIKKLLEEWLDFVNAAVD
jgi:hypothetical protein